ncbi:MAG: 50S ribosomal protein L11 methyltransferase [Bacteroidetes bacterium]|nr:MAG: 50S ribosomal protein L11 methyltransferase [Bacteroidota bacterium]
MESYLEFVVACNDDTKDMLIAELAEIGYDGFVESDNGFSAFIPQALYQEQISNEVFSKYGITPENMPHSVIMPQNWNAQWEANYEPIIVANKILVCAPFHQLDMAYEHALIIQPKNTFGTGHHETTQLVLELMLGVSFADKMVFDFGCGTGVLGLMALKLGAKQIIGNDIDEWCVDNITENKSLNNLTDFEFRLGGLSQLKQEELFDAILANINKNILLESFKTLAKHAKPESVLLISGFYEKDLADIKYAAEFYRFDYITHLTKNEWCAVQFKFS